MRCTYKIEMLLQEEREEKAYVICRLTFADLTKTWFMLFFCRCQDRAIKYYSCRTASMRIPATFLQGQRWNWPFSDLPWIGFICCDLFVILRLFIAVFCAEIGSGNEIFIFRARRRCFNYLQCSGFSVCRSHRKEFSAFWIHILNGLFIWRKQP